MLIGREGRWSLLTNVFDFFLIIYVYFFYKKNVFESFMSHWAIRGRDSDLDFDHTTFIT